MNRNSLADPLRTDAQIDVFKEKYCNEEYCGDTETFFAKEGMMVEL